MQSVRGVLRQSTVVTNAFSSDYGMQSVRGVLRQSNARPASLRRRQMQSVRGVLRQRLSCPLMALASS